MFLISSSMEYAQLESLLTSTTAKDMWDKLSQIHEQKSVTNKLLLTQKFIEYRMGANDSVVSHVAKVQNLARQLADVGENLSEVTVMAKILGSLTSKFSIFQTKWDSVDPERQNLASLQERLIKKEAKLNAESDAEGVFYTGKSRNSKKDKDQPHKSDKIDKNQGQWKKIYSVISAKRRDILRVNVGRNQRIIVQTSRQKVIRIFRPRAGERFVQNAL
ncbi:hypothetical protein X777_01500 [Ooceraea biroi]|uniref:Copia protein n=1 Tax=Ooceraea biroi TaxID=2015173 RepID=A0A026VSR3_OOCBI|nr:hypothetical protein X777_01500 [Ooceraea biroi]